MYVYMYVYVSGWYGAYHANLQSTLRLMKQHDKIIFPKVRQPIMEMTYFLQFQFCELRKLELQLSKVSLAQGRLRDYDKAIDSLKARWKKQEHEHTSTNRNVKTKGATIEMT